MNATMSKYRGKRQAAGAGLRLFLIMAAGLVLTGAALYAAWIRNPIEQPDDGSFVYVMPEPEDPPGLEPPPSEEDARPLIVVDAGHGGADGGTPAGGIPEKTFNLEIALRLREILERQGYRVLMTRESDVYVDKEQRAEFANLAGADLFISIHQNADESGAHGIETWYNDAEPANHSLAKLIQESTVNATGARDRGLWTSDKIVVLRETEMPSCLIETGFLSNGEELVLLKSAEYQNQIARGIAEGIHRYVKPDEASLTFGNPPAATPETVKSISWGLSFQENGKAPVANSSAEYLSQFGAAYLGDINQKRLWLTFDAGYENGYMESILDILERHGVPAAFFLAGHYIRSNPELVRRMCDEGHIVGNHTKSHPDMTALTELEDFQKELWEVEGLYKETTGQEMPRYYRPPSGIYSEHSLQQAGYLGYKTVFWSLAYVDWDDTNQPSVRQAYDKLLPRIHPGAILMLHSTSKTNAGILDELLTVWKAEGYTFGILDELF